MQCPRCQQENPSHAKFCLECGAPVNRAAPSPKSYADLSGEVERLSRALTESVEQQTATAEILRVISSSPTNVQTVLDTVAKSAVRLCDGFDAAIFRRDGDHLRLVAHHGPIPVQPELPLIRGISNGRAVLSGQTVHVADMQTEAAEFPEGSENARRMGHRTVLSVPLIGDGGAAIGTINVRRTEARLFTERQVALLQTFADQAVIAIENVRLFTELQAKNRDLTEALNQQVATAEILRVISASPTDLQPVFDAIAHSAVRLCSGVFGVVYRLEGDIVHLVAHHNFNPEAWASYQAMHPMPASRSNTSGRAMLDARVAFTEDTETDVERSSAGRRVAMAVGARSVVSVPMLRDGASVGAITVARREPGRFSDKQVALLQTFADQAVIAIENIRLFKELEARNADLTESLDRQTATAEILRVIGTSPTDAEPVFEAIARSAVRVCGALSCAVFVVEGSVVQMAATHGVPAERLERFRSEFPAPLTSPHDAVRAVRERSLFHMADIENNPEASPEQVEFARLGGYRTRLMVPMVRGNIALGLIAVTRAAPTPFSERQVELLRTFADQAVIAIENVRLFTELQEKNKALTQAHAQVTEALDRQTATSEILQVISQSRTEVQLVFDAIVDNATRLFRAWSTAVMQSDGQFFHLGAVRGGLPGNEQSVRDLFPSPIHERPILARCLADRAVVPIPDVDSDPVATYMTGYYRRRGIRSALYAPMLRDGQPIGVIAITRAVAGPFSPAEIELLQTFANQAVIAIENFRLLRGLEEKSRQLEAASQHKSEFLANMSHELRTPLNAIIGFSEVLSDRMFGELNEKQEEYLKDIHASGTHLLSLINDILDLSKIEAGRMELELSDFHLPTALDNALILVRERAGRRSITLQTNIDERLGEVRADERKIRQVVLNLLSNAIKFTPEGGRIEVRAVPVDGSVEVSVSDTGVGIAPEDQDTVFEEFRRVGTAEKKAEGTGLGLTLCRKFVELHGGRIWVQSQVGVGSTFTFRLPVRRGE